MFTPLCTDCNTLAPGGHNSPHMAWRRREVDGYKGYIKMYLYIYIYLCMYAYIYTYACLSVPMPLPMPTYRYRYMYMYMCFIMSVSVCVYIYTRFICMIIVIRTHTHGCGHAFFMQHMLASTPAQPQRQHLPCMCMHTCTYKFVQDTVLRY